MMTDHTNVIMIVLDAVRADHLSAYNYAKKNITVNIACEYKLLSDDFPGTIPTPRKS